MFTVLFAYVGVFFACFVARDLCRSGYVDRMTILPPPPLPIIFFPIHNSFFNTSDSYFKSARA